MDSEDVDLDELAVRRIASRQQAVKRVASLSRELGTRAVARRLGLNKDTVTRYRRISGLTPSPPLRHLGGGRWVRDHEEEDE